MKRIAEQDLIQWIDKKRRKILVIRGARQVGKSTLVRDFAAALNALRYLHEERPELPVIAAGSLLEFVLEDQSYPMPVGRIQYYYLSSMSFREVLLARGKEMLEENLHNINTGEPSLSAHQHLKDLYREYLYTGGMPEAVLASIEESNILSARGKPSMP